MQTSHRTTELLPCAPIPLGFFAGTAEEQEEATTLVAAITNCGHFMALRKDNGLEEIYFSEEASYVHGGYTCLQLQAELNRLAEPSPMLERRRLANAFSRLEARARARLLGSMIEHPAEVTRWSTMELSQLQLTTQPGGGMHGRAAHSDGDCHIVAVSYNVEGAAVCGYEHNREMQREMLLEPGHGWILCGSDVSRRTHKHYVMPSVGARVSLTFRYELRLA
jgi:hypothetical protein